MFDILVESTKTKQRSRAGRFFFLTGLLYATLLTVLVVWTILGFSPGLAEGLRLTATLVPPPPPGPPPPPVQLPPHVPQRTTQATIFAPNDGKTEIPKPETVLPIVGKNIGPLRNGPPDSNTWTGLGDARFVPSAGESNAPPPPPPRPRPTPEPTPEVKPTPDRPHKISEGVLQGAAIRRVSPQYPQMAKIARVAGAVQVQVTISEEGRVLDAAVVNGHPLLRQAALEAARQWGFQPTLLSNVPVKVQGILTFNFTLN